MEQPTIKVYARANERGQVDELLNTIFNTAEITNTDIFIDEGCGDAYAYPHTRFTLYDMQMRHNYKLVDGKLTATTDADKAQENNSMEEVEKAVPFSNPNLLINGGFDVWQRGDNFVIPNQRYTADRWWAQSGDGAIPLNGVYRHNQGLEVRLVEHRITYTMEDADFASIAGKPVTLSWSFNQTVSVETFVATSPLVFSKVIFPGILNWVKLELGTVATPFVPRHYGEELALCQRYYESGFVNFSYMGIENVYSAVTDYCEKRIEPTMKYHNNAGEANKLMYANTADSGITITRVYGHRKDAGTIFVSVVPQNKEMLITNYTADAEIY